MNDPNDIVMATWPDGVVRPTRREDAEKAKYKISGGASQAKEATPQREKVSDAGPSGASK